MPVDISLIKTTLRVLANNSGRDNLTEEIVAIDVEAILRKPLAAHQIRDALAECARHGWAIEGKDDFGLPTWGLTDSGRGKLGTL